MSIKEDGLGTSGVTNRAAGAAQIGTDDMSRNSAVFKEKSRMYFKVMLHLFSMSSIAI